MQRANAHRPALYADAADRRLQHQHRQAGGDGPVPVGRVTMSAEDVAAPMRRVAPLPEQCRHRAGDADAAAAHSIRSGRGCCRRASSRWRRWSWWPCSCSACCSSTRATTTRCRAPAALGRTRSSIRSPITASPAGSCGRSGSCFSRSPRCRRSPHASQQRVLAAIMVRVGFLFTAMAVPGLFDTIVKRLIGRARPLVGGHLDPTLFHPFAWRSDYASLPSGHATTVVRAAGRRSPACGRARALMP